MSQSERLNSESSYFLINCQLIVPLSAFECRCQILDICTLGQHMWSCPWVWRSWLQAVCGQTWCSMLVNRNVTLNHDFLWALQMRQLNFERSVLLIKACPLPSGGSSKNSHKSGWWGPFETFLVPSAIAPKLWYTIPHKRSQLKFAIFKLAFWAWFIWSTYNDLSRSNPKGIRKHTKWKKVWPWKVIISRSNKPSPNVALLQCQFENGKFKLRYLPSKTSIREIAGGHKKVVYEAFSGIIIGTKLSCFSFN